MEMDMVDRYFNKDLIDLVDKVTTSDSGRYREQTELYRHTRKMKVRMIIALLCNTMNPKSNFIQTFLGLHCYGYGLRDAGFDILNTFGCICSVDHIPQHGEYWSRTRKSINELDKKKFWRVSIDNLNFKLKFAKNFTMPSNSPHKMLNLITGQVTYSSTSADFSENLTPLTDKTLVLKDHFLVQETEE